MGRGTWKEYFAFSKKERIAIIILIACIAFSVVSVYLFSPPFKKPFVNRELQQQLAALQNAANNSTETDTGNAEQTNLTNSSSDNASYGLHPFGFDPNLLDDEGFKQMGLNSTTIQSINSYRNKGGHFNTPEDFKKMDGLSKEDADELAAYIQIKPIESPATNKENKTANIQQPLPSNTAIKKIDINTATAEDFKALPGITDVLGNRIIKFRNAVEGFKTVEDIRKTYGLTDSVYQLILPYLTIKDPAQSEN
ncbi:MAG TPA: helix-hairpin-helix domain-containing protein [Panacibacter sp.]|nr:helix-hairpin-helix domain-containing protein [Panacibacter sp.]